MSKHSSWSLFKQGQIERIERPNKYAQYTDYVSPYTVRLPWFYDRNNTPLYYNDMVKDVSSKSMGIGRVDQLFPAEQMVMVEWDNGEWERCYSDILVKVGSKTAQTESLIHSVATELRKNRFVESVRVEGNLLVITSQGESRSVALLEDDEMWAVTQGQSDPVWSPKSGWSSVTIAREVLARCGFLRASIVQASKTAQFDTDNVTAVFYKQGEYAMTLLTKEILDAVPPLYAQDGKGMDALVYAKFFTPDANWTWFMTEYDPTTRQAFGYVKGLEGEMGYFSLDELESVRGPMGLPVERDMSFPVGTMTLRDAIQKFARTASTELPPTSSMLACRPVRKAMRRHSGLFEDIINKAKAWFAKYLDEQAKAIDELEEFEVSGPPLKLSQTDASPEVVAAIKEFLQLKEQKAQLDKQMKGLKAVLQPEFERADQQMLRAEGIVYKALEKANSGSYKTAFVEALKKVNAATKKVLENCYDATVEEVDKFNLRPVKSIV